MTIRPKRNNRQHQPLTTVLRNIIREYPAGGGVLRELCQNADDAEATEIVFVLDERQHPTEKLLHEDLAEYQGPALLAFNNSVFSSIDFESLSRIGDSAKAKDPASTGKFGRGFNSVYNWTDNPSILSGRSLLFLDPHESWSASSTVNQPGGPLYDFVENATEPEMKNQLQAYSSLVENFEKDFHGTVIRIPLRTEVQALRSEIVSEGCFTTREEIIEVFGRFSEEMVKSLLFLKHVRKITLLLGNKVYAAAEAKVRRFDSQMAESPAESQSGFIKVPYRNVLIDQTQYSYDDSFLMEIASWGTYVQEGKTSKYAVTHHMRNAIADEDLQKWARSLKLFPWVAIAIPLEQTEQPFVGGLFSTLPLPISSKHPAYIHGMFSITPDRSTIHTWNDSVNKNTEWGRGSKWNEYLFNELVVSAWHHSLRFFRDASEKGICHFQGWGVWPQGSQDSQTKELGMGILSALFRLVSEADERLLPSICEETVSRSSCMFIQKLDDDLRDALRDWGVTIISPSESRKHEISESYTPGLGFTELSPTALRRCKEFQAPAQGRNPSPASRSTLLNYIFQNVTYPELGLCTAAIIPMRDGSFQSFLSEPSVGIRCILSSNGREEHLFNGALASIIDISAISPRTLTKLRSDLPLLRHNTKVSGWDMVNCAFYCQTHIFAKTYEDKRTSSSSAIKGGAELFQWIEHFWDWAMEVDRSELVSQLGQMWLVPIADSHFRKLRASNPTTLDVSEWKELESLLKESRGFQTTPEKYPLFGGPSRHAEFLRKADYIKSSYSFKNLLAWLYETSDLIDSFSDENRTKLLGHLSKLLLTHRQKELDTTLKSQLRYLSLFRSISFEEDQLVLSWTTLDTAAKCVGINSRNVPVVWPRFPEIEDIVFIDTSDINADQIIRYFQLAELPSPGKIIQDYVIPALSSSIISDERRDTLTKFVLENVKALQKDIKEILSQLQFIPVVNTEGPPSLKCPAELVDPRVPSAELYFPDELRFPTNKYYPGFKTALQELGMIVDITPAVVIDRLQVFSSQPLNRIPELEKKIQQLISGYRDSTSMSNIEQHLRQLKWIPASYREGEALMCSALECRDSKEEKLVGYAMPITSSKLKFPHEWREILGWTKCPENRYIKAQLEGAIAAEDISAVRGLIQKPQYIECIASEIEHMQWLPGNSCDFYHPSDLFLGGAHEFHPYIDNLDSGLRDLLKDSKIVSIEKSPSFSKLRAIQDILSAKETVQGSDLNIAVTLLNEVVNRFRGADFSEFKAPDTEGHMRPFSELTAGVAGSQLEFGQELKFLHPRIPQTTISALGFLSFDDRYIDNLDDSDFAQVEDPTTTIRDTLRRYPVDSTFTEYLANAEDCGSASEIVWILDKHEAYPSDRLLTKKLSIMQGPALLAYNDGVFSAKDFKAVVDIGVGSKREEDTKIGRFGRGALTMYHWTSVPSILSGEYLVVFDPEQERLPINPRTRRPRAGMKLKISLVRSNWPDHLKPFEGLFGFDSETNNFMGTLFRFPLLKKASTKLGTNNHTPFGVSEKFQRYMKEAKISLLFIKNIRSIKFLEKDSDTPIWQISADRQKVGSSRNSLENVKIRIEQRSTSEHGSRSRIETTEWCVISDNSGEHSVPEELRSIRLRHRLAAKCGIAAMISKRNSRAIQGRLFMDLPLRGIELANLPVHITADLVLQSNRESVPLPDGRNEEGADWNQWILTHGLVRLYLTLLEHLMKKQGSKGYAYWPIARNYGLQAITKAIGKAFWDTVLSGSCHRALYPTNSIQQPGSTVPSEIKCLKFSETLFNLEEGAQSSILNKMYTTFGFNNIAAPSSDLRAKLLERKSDYDNLITPQHVIKLLHSRENSDKLRKIWNEKKTEEPSVMPHLFDFLMKKTEQWNWEVEIDGCKILPLANSEFGILKSQGRPNFLVPEPGDRPVMDAALLNLNPSITVHPGFDVAITKRLLDSETINVTLFNFADVPRLFIDFEKFLPVEKYQAVCSIWASFRKSVKVNRTKMTEYITILNNLPLLSCYPVNAKRDGVPIPLDLRTLAEFNSGQQCLLVEQSDALSKTASSPVDWEKLNSLLQLFDGLYIVDSLTFPSGIIEEEMLTQPQGLYRFLLCLNNLAVQQNIPLYQYIASTVPIATREALKYLVTLQTWDPFMKDAGSYPDALSLLSQLPIWHVLRLNGTVDWIPATHAVLAPSGIDFSVLSDCESPCFFDPDSAQGWKLARLGTAEVSARSMILKYLNIVSGRKLAPEKVADYAKFVGSLARSGDAGIALLSSLPLALDGDRRFVQARTLFSHTNDIYKAAFHHMQDTHFLHPELRKKADIWNLYVNNQPESTEYYRCAKGIESQYPIRETIGEARVLKNAQKVFNTLCYDSRNFWSWWNQIVSSIQCLNFVPIASQYPANYRKTRMEAVGKRKGALVTLREAILPGDISIAWSQLPVYLNAPSATVLQSLPHGGRPSSQTVFNHLSYLRELSNTITEADSKMYRSDIAACYEYLQKCNNGITIAPDSDIWLNIEEEDTSLPSLNDCWVSTNNLRLGLDYDSLPLQRVQSFLLQFTSLLKSSGVSTIRNVVRPTAPEPLTSYPAIMLSRFQDFRNRKLYFDVRIEVGGETLGAHKLVLSAASEQFEKMFGSGMQETYSDTITFEDCTSKNMTRVLDFIYAGDMPPFYASDDSEDDMEELLELLEVSNRLFLTDLKTWAQYLLCDKRYIGPHSVRRILSHATAVRADSLTRECIAYIQGNEEFIPSQ